MPPAVRLNDLCSGHGCFPPRRNRAASPDVQFNGRGAHRVGDAWYVHSCGGSHGGVQATGSPNVMANGKPIARVGDRVSCGSRNATGSPDNNIN